jgi:hypothetical protein
MSGRCSKFGDSIKRTKEQLENPSGDKVDDFCSYLVPLSPEPPPRQRKRVRDIKVLDPACGSGHFLVYAFDVLFRMYREDEPDTPVEEIPRLVLENNLFGIDIDLRAVQLAALSLYLKAKLHNPKLKLTRMNLVCADARITDGSVRKAFLERFETDPELKKIFAKIFEDLEYTYDVGSLLRIREPFEKLLEKRREQGVQAALIPRIAGQTAISRSGKMEAQSELTFRQAERAAMEKTIEVPKAVTIEHMLEFLREFEREAMEKRDMGTLLFATEAEKSLGLLAILSEKYDVVLMNPAYGAMPPSTKNYVEKKYPRTKNDYYSAFIEQTVDLAMPNGFIGMLTSRTFMFLKKFQTLREDVLWNEAVPELVVDTGFGVLDGATVETAATVLIKGSSLSSMPPERRQCIFCRLTMYPTHEKEEFFMRSLLSLLENGSHELWFRVVLDDLRLVPGTTYAYWASTTLRALFTKYPPLDRDIVGKPGAKKIADLKQGLATADDTRFIRRVWEINVTVIGKGKRWVPFAKGGERAFYADIDFVVNWESDGEEVKDWITKRYTYLNGKWEWVAKNPDFYFREGLTYPPAATGFNPRILVRYLPEGCIFGHKGCGVFRASNETLWSILGILNSELAWFLLLLLTPSRAWEVGQVASLPYPADADANALASLGDHSYEAYSLLRELDTGNEPSTIFFKPLILQVAEGFSPEEKPRTGHPFAKNFEWSESDSLKQVRSVIGSKEMSIAMLSDAAIQREQMIRNRLEQLQRLIDDEVHRLYKIKEEDKKIIERELSMRSGNISLSDEEQETEEAIEEKQIETPIDKEALIRDHVARLASFYIKRNLESDPDGIIPLHELVQRIRKKLAEDFGEDRVDTKEREIQEILGKSFEDWVVTEYFDFHVNLYKRRPIFWHLTSSNFSPTRGSQGAINIFLYYHKLDRDIIPKILTNYLKPDVEATKWKTERLKRELQEARNQRNKTKEKELSKQLETTLQLLEEIQGFQKALETVHNPRLSKTKLPKNPTWLQQKIAEVRDNGYNPVIDYGVRVNIEPLKEAGLLHKAAQRVK